MKNLLFYFRNGKFLYSSLPPEIETSASEPLYPSEKLEHGNTRSKYTEQQISRLILYLGLTSFLFSILVLIGAIFVPPREAQCTKVLSPHSPMFDAVSYYETDFNNSFAHPSPYRGPPTPEREALWERLWNQGSIRVTDNEIAKLGKEYDYTPEHHYHKGKSGDAEALVEVFHQLHCLNLVRQYTWRHLYITPPMDLADPVAGRMHVDHCLETLRLSIMCYGDVTPLLINVDPDSPIGIKADFNVHHVCRRFDHLEEWMGENAIPSNVNATGDIVIKGYE